MSVHFLPQALSQIRPYPDFLLWILSIASFLEKLQTKKNTMHAARIPLLVRAGIPFLFLFFLFQRPGLPLLFSVPFYEQGRAFILWIPF